MTDAVLIAIVGACGVAVGAIIANMFTKNKINSEAEKNYVEGNVLISKEDREKEKFCMEQLKELQGIYKELREDNEALREAFDAYKRSAREKENLAREREAVLEEKFAASEKKNLELQKKISALEIRLAGHNKNS